MSCRHRRFAAELRTDAVTLRRLAEALDKRAAEQDQLARESERRRDLLTMRYADDEPGFRGLTFSGPAHAPVGTLG